MRSNPETTVLVAAAHHPSLEGAPAALLFGDEDHEGLSLSQEELGGMQPGCSALYGEVVVAVAQVLFRGLGLPSQAASVISREAVVSPVHVFMDRLVRLHRLAQSRPGRRLAVLSVPERVPADMNEFRAQACESFLFNQAVLGRLAEVLSLPCQEPAVPLSELARRPSAPAAVNFNHLGAGVAQRAARKIAAAGRTLLRLADGARSRAVPVLSMAYATEGFKTAGFYGGLLENIQDRAALMDAPTDPAIRRSLRDAVASRSEAVALFLESAGVGDAEIQARAASGLASFVAEFLPPNLLEAAPANHERCLAVLRPFVPRPLIVAEMCTLEPTCMMAAAKTLGMEVIGCQHGGYYGYIREHPGVLELEYPQCDRFITWGWERMPDDGVWKAKPVPLPSPWLSERRSFWARALPAADGGKEFDVLFMSGKLFRFPPAPTATCTGLPDNFRAVTGMFQDVASACSAAGLRVLHKPGNIATRESIPRALASMKAGGGEGYGELDTPHKGLDPAVLKRCSCVLWDQPGTGFLECLAAGIPTVAYWPGIFGRAEGSAIPAFQGLEATGLVPRTMPALIESLKAIKESPRAWLADKARGEAASRFLRSYGWADPRWADHWRRFLGSLCPAAPAGTD